MQDPQHARWTSTFGKVVDHLLADRDRTRWKLDPVWIVRMHLVTLLSLEAQGFHRAIDTSGETGRDEVEVVGFIFVLGIDRDHSTAGEDDQDSVRFEPGAHERGNLFEGRVFVDLDCWTHRGLPARRGRRRSEK